MCTGISVSETRKERRKTMSEQTRLARRTILLLGTMLVALVVASGVALAYTPNDPLISKQWAWGEDRCLWGMGCDPWCFSCPHRHHRYGGQYGS